MITILPFTNLYSILRAASTPAHTRRGIAAQRLK